MPDSSNPLFESQNIGHSLRLNAPAVFAREDFQAWLNDPEKRRMRWHNPGDMPHDYSDTVVFVDSNYEGSDSDMPEDIWRAICDRVYAEFGERNPEHVTVRLTNLE